MDAQLQEGLTTAQTVMTVVGSMGVVEAAKYVGEWWQKRRESKVTLVAAEAKAEQEGEAQDHQHSRESRKDRNVELEAVIAQKDAHIAKQTEAAEAYHKFAHDRLDKASAQILAMYAEKITEAAERARFEERFKACDEDRADLRKEVEALKERMNKVENGHDKA